MPKLIKFILAILVFLLALVPVAYFFVFHTKSGADFFYKYVLKDKVGGDFVVYGDKGGSLSKGLTLNNVEFKDLEWLPPGSSLKIQSIEIFFSALDLQKSVVMIENARLFKPQSDPIVLSGSFKEGRFDFNIFGNQLDVADVSFFLKLFNLDKFSTYFQRGSVGAFDVTIAGPLENIAVKGQVLLEEYSYKEFTLQNVPLDADIVLKKNEEGKYKISGSIYSNQWVLLSRGATVVISNGKISFVPTDIWPQIAAQGDALVDQTKIHISVRGAMNSPNLDLSSNPPMPQQKLLLMLATNKGWKGLDATISEEKLSSGLVADFVDYFMFGGSGGSLAKTYGIKDVWFDTNKDSSRIGVKKELLRDVDVGYEMQRRKDPVATEQTEHKVLGDVNLHKNVSLSVEKEVGQRQDPTSEKLIPSDDKVLLKYKSNF